MRKIEQRMVNAVNNKVNYRESNCVRLVQTTAQITNCVAANLLAKRKCLICVITAKRQYHKTYWKVQR